VSERGLFIHSFIHPLPQSSITHDNCPSHDGVGMLKVNVQVQINDQDQYLLFWSQESIATAIAAR
jgi:hypothetical protein